MKSLALLGALALISSSATAGFTGWTVERATTAGGNIQYKVYGNFDASNFVALNVYNFATVSGAPMNARHQDTFLNPDESQSQTWNPTFNGALAVRNEDSFVAISNVNAASTSFTALDPSFNPSDASYIPTNAGWYDSDLSTANAITAGGTDGGYRMMVLQIVRAGGVEDLLSTFSMVFGYKVSNTTTALAGSGSFTIGIVPAPGALALLGLAGLTGRRRRA
jgi:hypothetical protein